jgi:hypothetical protein
MRVLIRLAVVIAVVCVAAYLFRDPSPVGHFRSVEGEQLVGPAALLGSAASRRKSAAARRNGRKGGRPRKSSAVR